ncbi:MAG TPA: glycosyltransferase family 39 protein [Vicinamibacterales bacterium]|nr:glycosyltransferase family 39 protein [Vicinamibacterales bacterium]
MSVALAVLVALAGLDFRIGGLSIRAHGPLRVLATTGILVAIRLRFGVESLPAWLTRMVLLTAISGSVLTWFRYLLTTVGGADSFGYASASQLIAQGRLVDAAPIAEWLSAPNRLAIASPLGWAPSPDGSGIVPAYPIGVSMVMALFSLATGSNGVFFVAPVMGLVTLYCVWRLAREWYDHETALLATALVAWNPLIITYAKQPMSDIAATMWIALALLLAMRASARSAFCSGLAAGFAVITRPALLIAGALIPLAAHKGDSPRRRAMMSAVGFAIGVLAQMIIQNLLFGSPFLTGYGSAANLFSTDYFDNNLGIFGRHLWTVLGPLLIAGLVLGLIAARPEPRFNSSVLLGGVALPYLFYLPFDHWETLRFLLPGLVPLTILAADGLMKIARVARTPSVAAIAVTLIVAITAWQSERLLRESSVWNVSVLEARYPLAGEWINVNTPPGSVVLANQHSGSLRWYGKRQTLRWDFIAPDQLVTSVRELQSRGAAVYVALEGNEAEMFDQRFGGVIDQLQVDYVGRIRNVSFRRLNYLPAPNR